jgi:IS1 family transposase
VAFYQVKKTNFGSSRRLTAARVLDRRDTATFRRLNDKMNHLENCAFYTDDRNSFAEVLPAERHFAGKAHTIDIDFKAVL